MRSAPDRSSSGSVVFVGDAARARPGCSRPSSAVRPAHPRWPRRPGRGASPDPPGASTDGPTPRDARPHRRSGGAVGPATLRLTERDARADARPGDPVLVGAGDIAGCDWDDDEATAALLDEIDGTVFTAGDNVYPAGRDRDLRRLLRARPGAGTWTASGRRRATTTGRAARSSLPRLLRRRRASTRTATRGTPTSSARGRSSSSTPTARAVGGCGPDVAARGAGWPTTLAAADAAARSRSGITRASAPGTTATTRPWQPFWDALYAAGADVIVNGHEHDYERFAPQDPDGERGPRARPAPVHRRDRRGRAARLREPRSPTASCGWPSATGSSSSPSRDGGYEWRWIPVAGDEVADRGQASCH